MTGNIFYFASGEAKATATDTATVSAARKTAEAGMVERVRAGGLVGEIREPFRQLDDEAARVGVMCGFRHHAIP